MFPRSKSARRPKTDRPSILDNGASEVQGHEARNGRQTGGARAGAALSASWCRLPGKPDLVFRRWRTALFVNGCFWHSHNCDTRLPKTNVDYWTKKLQRNMVRDNETIRLLKKSGWRCVVIWECQAKDPAKLDRILRRLFASDRRR
jgi:DNA mismatch endonuclease Vsr